MKTINNKTENTNINTVENKESRFSWGAFAAIAAGLIYIYLIAMGSWTDNRFGTHLVLSTDLSSAGEQGWFLIFVAIIGSIVAIAGIVTLVLNYLGVIKLNESQDNSLKIGSTLLIGSAAFILALSSISFAAFNSQYFESEGIIEKGTSNQAWAWISLTIITTALIIGLTIGSMITNIISIEDKLYRTLRNSSIALVALGWFVFNLCINSFGAMGGDANVLVAGLTGNDQLLTHLGTAFTDADLSGLSSTVASMDAKTFYQTFLEDIVVAQIGLPGKWATAQAVFAPFYNKGTGPLVSQLGALGQLVASQGGLQNLLVNLGPAINELGPLITALGAGKEGMIMGVNNAFNSYLIFTLLLLTGLVGIPAYGVLTHGKEEKTSIMFWGSITLIIAMYVLYFFLTLTPYMVNSKGYESSILGGLLLGDYGPSIAPGLIALPGNDGGINSAIVYFSPQYNGTTIWWLSEVLTFIILPASFVGSWLTIKTMSKK